MVYFSTRSNCGDDVVEYLALGAGPQELILTSNITYPVLTCHAQHGNLIVLLSTLVYTALSTRCAIAPLRASFVKAVVIASRAGCAVCVGHRPVY